MKPVTKKLTLMAILVSLALIIFIIEAQIPLPVPIPGVKLGLANAVTLFALFYDTGKSRSMHTGEKMQTRDNVQARDSTQAGDNAQTSDNTQAGDNAKAGNNGQSLTTADAFNILFCRIILGAIFTGRIVAFIYSFSGGLFGFTAQVVMKRFISRKQIWVCGAVGAVFHNAGQILAAIVITGTPAVAAYLPVLIIAGIFTGIITGFIAQFTLERL